MPWMFQHPQRYPGCSRAGNNPGRSGGPRDRWSRTRTAKAVRRTPSGRYSVSALGHLLRGEDGCGFHTILLINDDDFARETLGQILEGDGYHVLRAANRTEAIGQLRGRPRPELIVLDLFRPWVDGWRFVRQQKDDPELADVPVIVLSAADVTRLQQRARTIVAGFSKPITVGELLAAIRRHFLPD